MDTSNAVTISDTTDQEGLKHAYDAHDRLYVSGDTLYVGGSVTLNDWFYVDPQIPLGTFTNTDRYRSAQRRWNEHPHLTKIVGHSLGASIAEALYAERNDRPIQQVHLYGAPRVSWNRSKFDGDVVKSFRHRGDPVSMFDRGAKANTYIAFDHPHSYFGFGQR